jgi:hypothetical protein
MSGAFELKNVLKVKFVLTTLRLFIPLCLDYVKMSYLVHTCTHLSDLFQMCRLVAT